MFGTTEECDGEVLSVCRPCDIPHCKNKSLSPIEWFLLGIKKNIRETSKLIQLSTLASKCPKMKDMQFLVLTAGDRTVSLLQH